MHIQPEKMIPSIQTACEETGQFIRSHFGRVSSEQIESKTINSLVSFVDKQAEQHLVKTLGTLLPEANFLTEEKMIAQRTGHFRWIIDPLDGTTNFLTGIPHFCISLALQSEDRLILGAVYDIMRQDFYHAISGQGAFLNGDPIQVAQDKPLRECVIATGFPYNRKAIDQDVLSLLGYFLQNGRGLRRLGSAALDLCFVAKGTFELYYEGFLNAWDIAAGTLIVEEAKGKVCDFSGGQDYLKKCQIIACIPGLLPDIIPLTRPMAN